jgi:DNA polymerase III sliding clamp (beta) subunit (PCNA family)
MAASQYDFKIEQGSSFRMSLIYKDSNGQPIDLTNYCARITWKTNTNKTQTFATDNGDLSLYNFYIETPASDGKITLLFPAATTNSFDFSSAKYDLELQDKSSELYTGGGHETFRILYGNIAILKRYSKSTELLDC